MLQKFQKGTESEKQAYISSIAFLFMDIGLRSERLVYQKYTYLFILKKKKISDNEIRYLF